MATAKRVFDDLSQDPETRSLARGRSDALERYAERVLEASLPPMFLPSGIRPRTVAGMTLAATCAWSSSFVLGMALVSWPQPASACGGYPNPCAREIWKGVSLRPGEIPAGGVLVFELTVDEVASGHLVVEGDPSPRNASLFDVTVVDGTGRRVEGTGALAHGFLVWRPSSPLLPSTYRVGVQIDNRSGRDPDRGCAFGPDVGDMFEVTVVPGPEAPRSLEFRVASEVHGTQPVFTEETAVCCAPGPVDLCDNSNWDRCGSRLRRGTVDARFEAVVVADDVSSSQFVVIDDQGRVVPPRGFERRYEAPTCTRVWLIDLRTGSQVDSEAVCVGDPARLVDEEVIPHVPGCTELYACTEWIRFPERCERWYPPADGPGATGPRIPPDAPVTTGSGGVPDRGSATPDDGRSAPSDTTAGLDDGFVDRGCVCTTGGTDRPIALFGGSFGLTFAMRRRRGQRLR